MGTAKQENSATVVSNSVKKPYGRIVLTLKNCLLPEEKLSPTPSQTDGLDKETETDLRVLGCELIQTAGILLKLPQVAMATGQVLFQRFYYSKSFVRHAMETTAMGCVCLASKIEEAPRRIRDVINVFHHIKQVKGQKTIQPMMLDHNYIALKTQVIKAERRVLKELGFCVHVKHPHKLIVMYLQVLGFEKNRTLMQLAWNYMNDSLRTDVFVQYQPETVACACIYLTARRLNIALPRTPPWFSIFRVEERDIQDICYRILRLYIRAKPNADVLEKRVEDLRRQYQEARQKARGTQNMNAGSISPSSPSNQSRLRNSPQRWGGFISRNNHSAEKNRSQSRSRSPSHSPVVTKHSKKTKKNRERSLSHSRSRSRSRSRTRTRSRSHERRGRKWSKNRRSYSRSVSTSPYKQRKARDKVRHRSRSRSHDRRPDSYDRYYSSSKSRSRHSSRDRKDRR
ncbi:cyclin-L1 isoform X1 [Anabrus simplex]|uniref:cyclin-L1 isoform X1 n=1 Tax=Anabrus simplex TaxID=316456 RepID=UPI0034DD5517